MISCNYLHIILHGILWELKEEKEKKNLPSGENRGLEEPNFLLKQMHPFMQFVSIDVPLIQCV